MIFRFTCDPGTTATGWPGALHHRGLVGAHKSVRHGFGESALEKSVAESLGRLRQHDEFAGNGGGDECAMRGALHLLDGVDRGQADDGRAVLDDRVDGALDGGRVDERPHRVMHQHDVVFRGGQRGQRVGHGFLAVVAAFHHLHAGPETVFGHLGLDALHLRLAGRHPDGGDAAHFGKGAQRVDQDRHAVQGEELFGLRPGHPSTQARRGKNRKHLHNSPSIHGRQFAWLTGQAVAESV